MRDCRAFAGFINFVEEVAEEEWGQPFREHVATEEKKETG